MRTIWKYPIPLGDEAVAVLAPYAAPIVLVALDPATGGPAVWIELDTNHPQDLRTFVVRGTGHQIGDGEKHVGSLIDGAFVWRVFEVAA